MSFGLKNVGAMYQRCMLKCFRDLIGQTIEAYVDDIVVKSKPGCSRPRADLHKNSEQTASNSTPRSAFLGVPRGMLLGFIVSECGIKANPEKISSIMRMGPI